MRLGLTFILATIACGPGAGDDDGGDTTTGTDADTSASASTTGAPSCEMYEATPDIGPAIVVTIQHDGTTPVFFVPHGCGGALSLSITTQAGEPVPYLLDGECFPNTCDGFVGAFDCSVGCNDCAVPQAGRIDAGASGEATWPGRLLTQLDLLDTCAPAADCPATCVRPDQAPAGTYELTFTAYRTCTGTCECDGPSSGICSLWNGDEQLADPVTFTATIDYPTQTTAEILLSD